MAINFDQLVATLTSLLPIIAMFSAMPIFPQWTKDAVAVVQAIISNPTLLDFLHKLFTPAVTKVAGAERTQAVNDAVQAAATPEVKAAAAAAGIDWNTLLQYLPQIITLLLSAFGLRR